MQSPPSSLLLLLFCTLHVLAIGTDAIPQGSRDPVSSMVRRSLQPLTRPYTRITFQWQRWDLFAPDPSREVVTVHVDAKESSGLWEERLVIEPGMSTWPAPLRAGRFAGQPTRSVGWWRMSALLKVARALAEEHPKYDRSRQEFLQRLCTRFGIPGGGTLRLRVREADLAQMSMVSEVVRAESVCSSPS